ncbi:imm11 family protein [Archangium lansingense]|uniref:imm11 family protein n=1 Tax=Archangium lansingense TaxID=2995310 RepID=UPI003B7E5DD4
MAGTPAHIEGRLQLPVAHSGNALDFSLADAGGFPVVTQKVASVLSELAPRDVQLFPVKVDSRSEPYFLVNVARTVKCIDDEASEEVRYWKPEDGEPERVGEYRVVAGMRIDPSRVGDARVFRPWGWKVVLVVSEDVKEALERTGATGMEFTEVTSAQSHSTWLRQVDAAREVVWRSLGQLEEDAIVPIVSGGPEWPGQRQAWRVIHRTGRRLLLVTDGLSDPHPGHEPPSVGIGLELAIETDEPVKNVQESWALLVLQRVANEVAEHERVRKAALTGLLTMEVSGKGMPKSLVTQEGRVGVLLGLGSSTLPQHLDVPAGQVRLVTVKTLLPSELAYRVQHGKQGRDELVRHFVESGEEHLSRAKRSAVV